MRMHRENKIAFLSAPATAGEGDRPAGAVEGAQDYKLRYRFRKLPEQELGACVND
jgi:hypothetical protein